MKAKDKIIVALDNMEADQAIDLAGQLEGLVWGFKIHDLFIGSGPEIVEDLGRFGKICLDLKFHDIPTTVANHAKKVARIRGVRILTVHASGGLEMMKEAVKNKGNCQVFAVIILDSLETEDCRRIYGAGFAEKFPQFVQEANEAGVDGIICPGRLLETLNSPAGLEDLKKIAVGIRSKGFPKHEHFYSVAPWVAIKAGAYKLIIGRPITTPPPEMGTPIDVVERIIKEIESTEY